MPYNVYDRVTGALMGTYKTLKRAHTKKDALDNEYGGYRYGVDKVKANNNRSKLKIKKTA